MRKKKKKKTVGVLSVKKMHCSLVKKAKIKAKETLTCNIIGKTKGTEFHLR